MRWIGRILITSYVRKQIDTTEKNMNICKWKRGEREEIGLHSPTADR